MPRANIYIRNENEAKWEAIPDKSNWINTLLAASGDTSRYGAVQQSPVGPRIEVLTEDMDAEPVGPILTPPPFAMVPKESLKPYGSGVFADALVEQEAEDKEYEFCKHDQVKGMCKYGCK